MINWDDEQLDQAGIDKARLRRLVKKLEDCGREMDAMGLHLYGQGSGTGTLIHKSRPTHGWSDQETPDRGSVVASILNGIWSGGDW